MLSLCDLAPLLLTLSALFGWLSHRFDRLPHTFGLLAVGLLAFLLFAGALHVDLLELRGRAWTVGLMATVGVVVSTAVVGHGFWVLSAPLGWPVPLAWALVFGALISPPTRSWCSAR